MRVTVLLNERVQKRGCRCARKLTLSLRDWCQPFSTFSNSWRWVPFRGHLLQSGDDLGIRCGEVSRVGARFSACSCLGRGVGLLVFCLGCDTQEGFTSL